MFVGLSRFKNNLMNLRGHHVISCRVGAHRAQQMCVYLQSGLIGEGGGGGGGGVTQV